MHMSVHLGNNTTCLESQLYYTQIPSPVVLVHDAYAWGRFLEKHWVSRYISSIREGLKVQHRIVHAAPICAWMLTSQQRRHFKEGPSLFAERGGVITVAYHWRSPQNTVSFSDSMHSSPLRVFAVANGCVYSFVVVVLCLFCFVLLFGRRRILFQHPCGLDEFSLFLYRWVYSSLLLERRPKIVKYCPVSWWLLTSPRVFCESSRTCPHNEQQLVY